MYQKTTCKSGRVRAKEFIFLEQQSVRFLTRHFRNGRTDPLYVAEHAADPDLTLVVYMGLSTLPALVPKLMKHGLPADTPAIAVERGTTPQQRTVYQFSFSLF